MLLFRVSMGLVYDFSTKICVSLISQQAPKKSFNWFGFVLILDNLRAICLTAAFNFFNNQKIWKKYDLMRPSRMILVNPFRFESSFNLGCPWKFWTKTFQLDFGKMTIFLQNALIWKRIERLNGRFFVTVCWSAFVFFIGY